MSTASSRGTSTAAVAWVQPSAPPAVIHRHRRSRLPFYLDALGAASAVVAGELLAPGNVPRTPPVWAALFLLFLVAFLYGRGRYERRLRPQTLDDVRTIVGVTAMAAIVVLSIRAVVADDAAAAGQTVRMWVFAAFFLAAARVVFSALADRVGATGRPTLIIGAGNVGQRTAKRLLDAPGLGLRPVGFLDKEPLVNGNRPNALPVLGASWDLDGVVARYGVAHVIITFSTAPDDVLLRIARRCDELGIGVSFVPRFFERMKERVIVEHLGGLPLLSVEPTNPKAWQFGVKYAIDRAVAAALLLLAAPVFIGVAVAVWASMGRPILYRQRRVGRDGREFDMLKFRSMKTVTSATDEFPLPALLPGLAPGGVEGVDRRTHVGRFIRRTAIDELPQLLNVLSGDMSIVGPRPERPEFVEKFERDVHRYGERHRVKAGITGWAQVHGLRGKTSLADRVEWDNYYIDNWSLWLDFKIVLATGRALVRFPAE
jgi:exopolysaccharide biosynthesis polyprenyl glycosylphosphotransferase